MAYMKFVESLTAVLDEEVALIGEDNIAAYLHVAFLNGAVVNIPYADLGDCKSDEQGLMYASITHTLHLQSKELRLRTDSIAYYYVELVTADMAAVK